MPAHACPLPPSRSSLVEFGLRLSRRALLHAAPLALLAACRGSAPAPPATAPPSPEPAATPRSAPTAAGRPSPTPPAATPGTPAPRGPQVFYQGGFTHDPLSHDFNANRYCGGEPELWAGLLMLTPDLEPAPDWAESWSVSADGRIWTFRLRPDNRGWSNGDPVTADDFVWSWRRKLAPETGAPDAAVLFPIAGAREVHRAGAPPDTLAARAIDTWTLEVELTTPSPHFLAIVASIAAVPAHRPSVERHGARWTEAGLCVSNGPFLLTRWDHGEAFELARNPNYWDAARIALDRCVTPIIPPGQGLAPYDDGRVDYLAVSGQELVQARQRTALAQQLGQAVEPAVWCLIPQATVPPFDDPRVREAISRAIDRERLVQITDGRARAAYCLMPPGLPGHLDDPTIVRARRFDVDAALAALEDTPFAGGQHWPALSLTMREADTDAELLAHDIVAQLRENLGLELTVAILDPDTFDQAMRTHEPALLWLRWWFAYPDPHNGYGDLFAPDEPESRILAWADEGYRDLVEQARREPDPARRLTHYRQCEEHLLRAVAYVPVVYPVTWYLFQPWVRGIPTNRQGDWVPRGNLFTRMKAQLRIEGRSSR
ncbi:MAG: peptide ABC transporter substrate-binding protein [Sphaerobacter sp.]|nr:peptide ABC transporter substrate-binding protein [Sphaerobacter sp.]